MSESVLPMFSSRNFIVYGFIFLSLIYFEFIFVHGVRKYSSFILLTDGSPVFPAQLVKEIVFSPLYILASFVKDKVSIGAWIISGLSILFHWCTLLSLCQYHTVLMTVAL